ncbi:MAG TPA: SRPBCC domain-containing protein [Bryobacteraceae bacterium]|nr:SRPBCC domain-containing protein [Bryobacteraceae bacterium]
MSAQTVIIRKTLPATREEVFDAWLDAEGMSEWMHPGPVTDCAVTLDARVGGRFRIVMAGPGVNVVNTGEFRELNRPSRLQFTWTSSRWDNQETLITIELRERETNCELVLTHERFPSGHSTVQLEGGWNQILGKLGEYVAQAQ